MLRKVLLPGVFVVLVSVITICFVSARCFVSASLIGLALSLGVIFGPNIGATMSAWLVPGVGLTFDMAAYALPMVVFGVILLFRHSKTFTGLGYILGCIENPRESGKRRPTGPELHRRGYDHSRDRDAIFDATHTAWAPWHVVRAVNERRARPNCISHLRGRIPYEPLPRKKVKLGKRRIKDMCDDLATLQRRRFVPEAL